MYRVNQNHSSCEMHVDIENYLVGAMDQPTATNLREKGFPWFAMYERSQNDTGLGVTDFGWGTGKFHLMGRLKINLLKTFLGFGLDIMLCDTDTVWINDPTDYFGRFPAADILTSSDQVGPDRKSTCLNSSHLDLSRMPSSA